LYRNDRMRERILPTARTSSLLPRFRVPIPTQQTGDSSLQLRADSAKIYMLIRNH
jgi:hypothetical protein